MPARDLPYTHLLIAIEKLTLPHAILPAMTSRIPQHIIQTVLERTDIVDLIQARVQLKKRGHNYLACCPFHQEKTPSFTVSAQKQFYYCFGCGAHGNAISFLMEYDRMSFVDAITDLATKLGFTAVAEETNSNQPVVSYAEDYALLEEVSQFYQQQLRTAPDAIKYLKSRGMTGQTAKKFGVGFAPNEWQSLAHHISQEDKRKLLITHGLLQASEQGRIYDRFRHRVIFPIKDVRGKVIAFGGRTITDEQPKYLNSPETPVFHKNQEIYGLYEALMQNRQLEFALIVEGYLDVITLHQAGLTNAVATMGTAINARHIQKLLRYTPKIVFCFDGDNAGQQAAWKALTISLPLLRDGIQFEFLFLSGNDDPDSLMRRVGLSGFQQRLKQALPLSEVFFQQLQREIPLTSPDNKARFGKAASDYLNQMPTGIFRELMYKELANRMQVYMSDLQTVQTIAPRPTIRSNLPQRLPPVLLASALLLEQPSLVSELPQLPALSLPHSRLLNELIAALRQQPDTSIGTLIAHWQEDPELQQQIAELAARSLHTPDHGIRDEFLGAIMRVLEQEREQTLHTLIQKAKVTPLTGEEKQQLQELLAQQVVKEI